MVLDRSEVQPPASSPLTPESPSTESELEVQVVEACKGKCAGTGSRIQQLSRIRVNIKIMEVMGISTYRFGASFDSSTNKKSGGPWGLSNVVISQRVYDHRARTISRTKRLNHPICVARHKTLH
jgi:hypothetical protein